MWKVCRKRNDAIRWPLRFRFGFGVYVKQPLFNYSISQVTYVHSSRTTDESLHFRLLQKTKTLSRANADFDFQTVTQGHLVRSEFFCKDLKTKLWNLRVKKMTKFRKHTHTHTPRSADALWFFPKGCACTSLSLSLSPLRLDPDQTQMEFRKECFVNLKICACDRK